MLISARGIFTGKKEISDLIVLMNRSKKKFLSNHVAVKPHVMTLTHGRKVIHQVLLPKSEGALTKVPYTGPKGNSPL